jgi:hypothetical protein
MKTKIDVLKVLQDNKGKIFIRYYDFFLKVLSNFNDDDSFYKIMNAGFFNSDYTSNACEYLCFYFSTYFKEEEYLEVFSDKIKHGYISIRFAKQFKNYRNKMILNIKKSEHALLWAHEIGNKEKMKPLINDYKSAYGWIMNICLCNKERKEMINIIKKQRDIISIDEMLHMDAVNFVETKEEVIYLAKRISETIELKSTDWVFNLDKFFKLRYVTFYIFNNRSDFKFLFENEVFKILYSFLSCKNLYETAMNLFSVSCNYSEKNLFCLKSEKNLFCLKVDKNCREKILIDVADFLQNNL